MKLLTQEYLKKVLFYNPDNGIFFWKISKQRINKGDIAGTISDGYCKIRINGIRYKRSHLAFLYMKGYIPSKLIDHKNQNKLDDSWSNLREVDKLINAQNTKIPITNTSGIKGVSFSNDRKKWRAYISINQKRKNLGSFDNFIEAVCHRLAAEQCLNWQDLNSSAEYYVYKKKS